MEKAPASSHRDAPHFTALNGCMEELCPPHWWLSQYREWLLEKINKLNPVPLTLQSPGFLLRCLHPLQHTLASSIEDTSLGFHIPRSPSLLFSLSPQVSLSPSLSLPESSSPQVSLSPGLHGPRSYLPVSLCPQVTVFSGLHSSKEMSVSFIFSIETS